MKSVCSNIFFRIITLFICSLLLLKEGVNFAGQPGPRIEGGIKIIEPKGGTIVHPGQEITITIEDGNGFILERGIASIAGSEHNEDITSLPTSFADRIPLKTVGKAYIIVYGRDRYGNIARDRIELIVQQTATLQLLQIDQDKISVYLDWDGNIKKDSPTCGITTVYGLYSDGIERILDNAPGTIYTSSDSSIISVDNKGDCIVRKVGQASIAVSNSGITKVIPVVFEPPTGLRPSETIPPTTQIDIQPPANSAGWNNTDITITLTAQDNEGGSGIQEVDWRFPGKAKEDYVNADSVVVAYDIEGIKNFSYWSRDKEGNEDDNKIELRLDKTPPSITSTITPGPNPSGWHNSDVIVSFTAQDSLSGIKTVTSAITLSTEGANQTIPGEAIDIADNKAATQVTLNLDKTPPAISLELNPITLSNKEKKKGKEKDDDEGNWHQLLYSATDTLSGLKSLKAGLAILPIEGYNIELEQDDELNITIDEKEKELEIDAPNPQQILTQLQSGLLTLNNTQILQLKLKQGEPKWKIKEKDDKGIEIQAPSIIFKVTASDYADNTATKELDFKKGKDEREDD